MEKINYNKIREEINLVKQNLTQEVWLPIPPHLDYLVSSFGRISCRLTKEFKDTTSNRSVSLDGQTFIIARLVYETFIGRIPEGWIVHHKNTQIEDNCITNLECLSCKTHSNHHIKLNSTKKTKIVKKVDSPNRTLIAWADKLYRKITSMPQTKEKQPRKRRKKKKLTLATVDQQLANKLMGY